MRYSGNRGLASSAASGRKPAQRAQQFLAGAAVGLNGPGAAVLFDAARLRPTSPSAALMSCLRASSSVCSSRLARPGDRARVIGRPGRGNASCTPGIGHQISQPGDGQA